jgi:hypothetical protein
MTPYLAWAASDTLRISPTMAMLAAGGIIILAALAVFGGVPLQYNIRNLIVRWPTTLLTGLAFVLVTGLLVVMMAFVNGMYRLTEQSGQPGNVIILSEGATDEVVSNLGYGDVSDLERQPGVLTDEKNQPLASKESYLIATTPLPLEPGKPPRRRFVQLRGLDDSELSGKVHGLNLLAGSWLGVDDPGVQPAPDGKGLGYIRCVVGEGFAASFADAMKSPKYEVGSTFELAERTWVIVGIMASAGTTFDSEIWGKRSILGEKFGKTSYTTIVLRTEDDDAASDLVTHFKTNYTKSKVAAFTETEYFASLSETNRQFSGAIAIVALFMAIGGAFGIMNTMFAMVAQRTKDIGVLRILGFRRWQVLASFLLESLLLAVVGGLIGCAFATLFHGTGATSVVGSGGGPGGKTVVLQLVVDANLIAVGLVFALLMGLIGGLAPSVAAVRLRPLESLR